MPGAGVPGFGPPQGAPGAPAGPPRPSGGPAGWLKAHPAQAAGVIGAGGLGLHLLRKKAKGAAPGAAATPATAGQAPTSTADTTATDLYNQIQPEIDALGAEVTGLQGALAGSIGTGSSSSTSTATGTDPTAPAQQPPPAPAKQPAPTTVAAPGPVMVPDFTVGQIEQGISAGQAAGQPAPSLLTVAPAGTVSAAAPTFGQVSYKQGGTTYSYGFEAPPA